MSAVLSPTKPAAAAEDKTIRPFRVDVPEAELTDLRRRIKATRWPEKETVADTSQGVPLAPLQDLAHYWATDYDWRKCEAKLKALPHFMTEIDGMDIHFIHVRSKHEDALPPYAVGFVSGSMIFSCSMIEPGHPWVTITGNAFFSFERT